MSAKPIHRITLFKIPDVASQEKLIAIYKTFPEIAKKNGQPYIMSIKAGPAFDDQRAQGYTLAVVSVFASVDDMKYYDEECEAHKALKVVAKGVHQGIMMVYFESVV